MDNKIKDSNLLLLCIGFVVVFGIIAIIQMTMVIGKLSVLTELQINALAQKQAVSTQGPALVVAQKPAVSTQSPAPAKPEAPQAAKKEKLDVVTQLECPMGGGTIMPLTIMGNFISKSNRNLILRPQETPGYLYNIREMAQNKARWKNTVFGSEETIMNLASAAGGTPELAGFLPVKIDIPWKVLWSFGTSSAGLWYVTIDPKIKTIADLKGKKIGLGLRTQSNWGMDATLFLNVAYGINSDNSKLFYLGPAKMTDSLLDGKVDAIAMGLAAGNTTGTKRWLPSAVYMKLKAANRKLYYIPMDTWAIDKINEKYGTTYRIEKVAAGSLKDQEGELTIGADRTFSTVHPDFPEELAYKYVMAIAQTAPEIREYHPVWKFVWNLEGMLSGLTEKNTHPGAIRAFKELGIWDKRKDYPPFNLRSEKK